MEKVDLYNYPKRLETALAKVKEDSRICEDNQKTIASFAKIRLAKGSSHGRVAKVAYCMRFWAIWFGKPFSQATKDDLIGLIGDLETKNFAEYTKYDFKIVLKMFYKWLLGNDEEFPAVIKWLKPAIKNEKHKLPEELLTEEEVLKMANATQNMRDKALVLVLYEAGCRIGELLSLQMKNVQFDQYGAVLRVTGKTGDRRVRIISSAPILGSWINIHPDADNPDAMLWHSSYGKYLKNKIKCLSHGTVYEMVRELADKAGVKKKVHPHLFRHSRATSLAGKLTEAQMKEYFGWVQGSDMAATYVHLSGRDVDNALLKLQGLVKEENVEDEKMKVKCCQRCKERNSPISTFCTKCGLPLDQELIMKVEKERQSSDDLMNKLMEDPEFRDIMMKKILEKGLDKGLVQQSV